MTEEEFMGLGGTVDNESEDVQTGEEGNTEEVIDNVDEPEVEETGADDGDNDTTQSNDEPEQPQGVQPTAVQQAYRERLEQEYQQAVNRINPYTGRVIQSPQDFFEYKRQFAEEQQRHERQQQYNADNDIYEAIQNGTASRAQFDKYIKEQIVNSLRDNPDIRAAREAALRIQQEEQRARIESGKERVQKDLDALNKEYSNCKFKKADEINGKMADYMRMGLSVADAYYLTNRESIAQAQMAGVRQATINQANGKGHLKSVSGGTNGDVIVPDDIAKEYRNFFPDWTDKMIAEDYKKRNGGKN